MRLKIIIPVLILAGLVFVGGSYFAGYQLGVASVKTVFQDNASSELLPFLKRTVIAPAIEGKLVKKEGDVWTVENNGDVSRVSLLPRQKAYRGNEFSGNDYPNWLAILASETSEGSEIIVRGYVHPEGGYIIPTIIFVYNK